MAADSSLEKILDAMSSSNGTTGAAGPSVKAKKEVTYEDFQSMLDSTPLFMRETPKDSGENDVLEALRSLVFEGEGDEVALNFKNHGNELYSQKTYGEAIKAYTSGIDAGPKDTDIRISLLNNRAACHIALKNYGQALKDTGLIIALCLKPPTEGERRRVVPVKAMYRAGQALVALERWKEAKDVIARSKEMEGQKDEKVWRELEGRVKKGVRRDMERYERIRRERLGKEALRKAVEARGLISLHTSSPPDNPHPIHFDPDSLSPEPPLYTENPSEVDTWSPPDQSTPIIFPTFLLYPAHQQSDLITHFNENSSFEDQLTVMFPLTASGDNRIPWAEWDEKHDYWTGNLVIYVETAQRRLLKVGKELTLREILTKAVKVEEENGKVKKDGVVLRDGLLSFVVLVKGQQEKSWIEEFKRKRDEKK